MSSADLARQRAAQTKRERTRNAIIDAARTAFTEHGYESTTVEGIARAARVGVATVYSHYPTKAVIAGHVYRPVVEDLLSSDEWHDQQTSAVETLVNLIGALVTRAKENAALTIALLDAVQEVTARRGNRIDQDDPRYWVPLPPLFTAVIKRGQESAELDAYPPAEEAGAMTSNWILLRILTRPAESLADTHRFTLTTLARIFCVQDHQAVVRVAASLKD